MQLSTTCPYKTLPPGTHLWRRDGDAQHRAHHSAVLENLLHQAPHCTSQGQQGWEQQRAGQMCLPCVLASARRHCSWCGRACGGTRVEKKLQASAVHLRSPVSMGMAKPMPLLAPLPVGSAIAVLMPAGNSSSSGHVMSPTVAGTAQLGEQAGAPCLPGCVLTAPAATSHAYQ